MTKNNGFNKKVHLSFCGESYTTASCTWSGDQAISVSSRNAELMMKEINTEHESAPDDTVGSLREFAEKCGLGYSRAGRDGGGTGPGEYVDIILS